ncbi:hypothetical protein J7W08_07635 [Methanococcoides orientis]|uniref:hypothetical protein n=1 Tax=Methanococcoides TaxID=2225 RepID=UPI0014382C3C|nr:MULTISPECIES: hypothetical protein [Methanococcoides]UGV39985.1 hypothetical protein J7W08_07635 [Methanococcoides orientis]
MELVKVYCEHCGSEIIVYDTHVKKHMYCTIHCLESAGGGSSGGSNQSASA